MQTFQQLILALNHYWDRNHCALLQPYDMEVGAGTFHTATFLRAIGPEPWNAAYVQPSRRPKDGRYGENPNRLQHYYQYQVVLKPSPANILDLYLGSLKEIGIDPLEHDIRFVEDDWESPTLGAWGLGWEVWLNGMEVTQFTYFQEVGGIPCRPVMGEITYGIERLAMYLQQKESIFDLVWAPGVTYRDVYHQNEVEQSTYNFEQANVDMLLLQFGQFEGEAKRLFEAGLALPGYEMVMKCSHSFNLLDARGAISVTERAAYIGRVRALARAAAQSYYQSRKQRGFERASEEAIQAFVSKEEIDEVLAARKGLPRALAAKPAPTPEAAAAPAGVDTVAPLLVELFTEELPPKALQRLGEAFAHGLRDELTASGLLAADCGLEVFATPRRLAARFSSVPGRAPDRQIDERLLPEKVGLDAAGKPTAALLKKLAALGRDESALASIKKASDGKLVMLFLPQLAAGLSLQAALSAALEKAIARLPIPKVMSYQLPGSVETVKFVRPAHGLVALHGADVVDVQALGLAAGRGTHGHRFLGARDIELKDAGEYETRLKDDGKVIANFGTRRAVIEAQLKEKASALGCTLGEYEALLDEVTALVEWPVVYAAGFEKEFLSVPQECLILTMRTNQKYFPLFDSGGKLTEKFLVVSNMQVADPRNIIEGNQRVVRPRLADARFFYDQDRKARLETRVPALSKVVYHNKLGSQLERVERIQLLAGRIARRIGAEPLRVEHTQRAAWLAKADLQTGMVGEFPELQGIMGRYYARHDGEPEVVADAIAEHYLPRFAGDRLPQSQEACCVALADKLDTIIGIFGTGAIPTGDKDPFALRRHALGVIRILAERQLPLHFGELLELAHGTFPKGTVLDSHDRKGIAVPNAVEAGAFVTERARSYLRELGYTALEVESVLDLSPRPLEYVSRLDAARKFLALPESAGLAEADKRIRNILSKSGAAGTAATVVRADTARLMEIEEKQLLNVARALRAEVDALLPQGQFSEALLRTAQLHQPVTQFFDKVMVNVEDQALRENRFALLHEVGSLTHQVVNISKLAT